MRPRWIVVCLVLVWTALGVLVALVAVAMRAQGDIRRELREMRDRPPQVIYKWGGSPESEVDDAGKHLDKSGPR